MNLLKSQGHGDCLANDLKVHRPWGTYESIMTSKNVRVKHIIVKPGGKLSLQLHAHRSEHWVVVKGIADVVCAEKSFQLYENESIYILKNTFLIGTYNSAMKLFRYYLVACAYAALATPLFFFTGFSQKS